MGYMTSALTPKQKSTFKRFLEEFRGTEQLENQGEMLHYRDIDKKRDETSAIIKKALEDYLKGKISLQEFKQASSDFCFAHPYWGFKSFSGQMQLNQYANNIGDPLKEEMLKKAITPPKDLQDAVAKINEMAQFLGDLKVGAENPKSIPRTNQTFLLTYFWSMQEREKWPIYYGSYKKQFPDIEFPIEAAQSPGEEYAAFVMFFDALKRYAGEELGVKEDSMTWFVEHVLWVQFLKKEAPAVAPKKGRSEKVDSTGESGSWIPPIISDLPQLAANTETTWSKTNKVSPERAFEIKLQYVFQILGYQVIALGQGSGREPDGVAISTHSTENPAYAIVFDGKSREKTYSIGTEDRAITEYIKNKRKELNRIRVDKLSFLIVTSEVADTPNTRETAKRIYQDTRVPMVLMRADDLLHVVEEKLKNIDIDHKQLEGLFIETGLLTREKIAEVLGAR